MLRSFQLHTQFKLEMAATGELGLHAVGDQIADHAVGHQTAGITAIGQGVDIRAQVVHQVLLRQAKVGIRVVKQVPPMAGAPGIE